MGKRVISMDSKSMVYHRSNCRYAKQIHEKNKVQMKRDDIETYGYRPCKCCSSVRGIFNNEKGNILKFTNQHNMDVDLLDDKLYIRTDVGCWKIRYKPDIDKLVLLHKNYVDGRIDLDEVENGQYHRQVDIFQSDSIMKYINYIYEHDRYKKISINDYRQLPQDTKKQKAHFRSAMKREKRRSARRLDSLFAEIERKEGIKALSFC